MGRVVSIVGRDGVADTGARGRGEGLGGAATVNRLGLGLGIALDFWSAVDSLHKARIQALPTVRGKIS